MEIRLRRILGYLGLLPFIAFSVIPLLVAFPEGYVFNLNIHGYLDNKLKILEKEKKKENFVNSIPADEEFIILNIHRPMLSYDTCGFIDSGRNYSCELVDSVTRQLRGVDVNLSYIQKCKFT